MAPHPDRPAHEARVYDELLFLLARQGDRRAGDRLAARFQPRLLRTARRLLGDDDQARDAVQEAWAGICRGWHSLRDPASFPAWAFSILHRKCTDRIRQEIRRRERAPTVAEGVEAAGSADGGETRLALSEAFAALPPERREAAILFFGEGLTLAEIAAVTAVPVGTVKSRLFAARAQLKSSLQGDLP